MGRRDSLTLPAIQYIISTTLARMDIRKFDALPRLAAIVWGLTFPMLATFGRRLSEPPTLALAIGVGLASVLILLARNPNSPGSNLMLWLSGGIWTGASYENPQVLGFAYLVVALLTLGSAVLRERERGKLSLSGPAAFIAATLITVAVSTLLAV